LDPGGAGASWAPTTKAKIAKGYGRWLTWLKTQGLLDPATSPMGRVDRERIAQYVAGLQAVNAPFTVVARVQELYLAIRAMVPGQDWSWIRSLERLLRRTAHSVRNKPARLVSSSLLFSYGLELMNRAEAPTGGTPLQRAVHFRDGLMVSLLAARPLRRRNFCSIEIGRHLTYEAATYRLRFEADETKTREPIEMSVPKTLIPSLERYLAHYRPLLKQRRGRWNREPLRRAHLDNALWISEDGSAMTEIAIYFRIMRTTRTKFGHGINPHLFRDSAATSIAIEDPDHVLITRSVLGHATLRASERHYNHAQSLKALRRYQEQILRLQRQSRGADA
jgi:integrase